MLKDGSKVTIHFINHWNYKTPKEINTGYTGKVFTVKTENGKQGIDGNIDRIPYVCRGELFTPFSTYAWTVIFKDIDTGKLYRYSNMIQGLEDVTENKDGYIDQINWIA